MWGVELVKLGLLRPAEQLWIIAQAVEENGGPQDYVLALRTVADRLEEVGWWLTDPLDRGVAGALCAVPDSVGVGSRGRGRP
jgi:hypothetical protein